MHACMNDTYIDIAHEMAWMSERRGKYRIHVCSRSRLLITRLLKIFSLHLLYSSSILSIYLTSSFPNYKLTTTLFLSFLSSFWSLHNTLHSHTYIFSSYQFRKFPISSTHSSAKLTQVHIFLSIFFNTIKPSVFRLCANFLFQFHQIFYFNFFKKFLLWIWLVRYIFIFLILFLFISL